MDNNSKNDLTFFTNEKGATLLDRFKTTLTNVRYFDILVGYFRSTGFFSLYESFENIEKIRIVIGLSIDERSYEIIEKSRDQKEFDFESQYIVKEKVQETVKNEIDNSDDTEEIEIGVNKFLAFLTADCKYKDEDINRGGNGKKLEFRAFPSKNIHAKVYISRFNDNDRDYGRVITGSSNFSISGLIKNREFNVELKNISDVEFALKQFEDLWKESVDVSKEYVDTINKHTWLNDDITPYELYLKFLYEYFQEEINTDDELDLYLPDGFKKFAYQQQAVISAKKMLEAYNGVFLADVVGLGKTYISALLAQQLQGKILVICPPVLKDYWIDTFRNFGIRGYKVESLGKLDDILKNDINDIKYIFIDEAHRFRNEMTYSYEKLHEICFGKKVILVSATPFNNKPDDIFSQLKLFQIPKKSLIPGLPNLTAFFNKIKSKLMSKEKSDPEYIHIVREVSKQIREKIFKYIMVRRTRGEIIKYYSKDIKKQNLTFPDIKDPNRIIYKFNGVIEEVFNKTVLLLKKLLYARYTPLLNLSAQLEAFDKQHQINICGFMKGLLIKRLESSFFAFKNSVSRFKYSYQHFIDMFNSGAVYISKKINVYDFLENDNEEELIKLIEEGKGQKYKSSEFNSDYITKLNNDLNILDEIQILWSDINVDPKLEKFIDEIKNDSQLKNNKLLVFTESKETGEYLYDKLYEYFDSTILQFSSVGGKYNGLKISRALARDHIKENFDPLSKIQKDDIRIVITTDILAEGINLHRANVIINYDLPWNPARVLQRVGRVNRVGTKHDYIYIYNFFPTSQSDKELGLEENIKSKIQAFHDTLGEDTKYLSGEEIVSSHGLFGSDLYNKLNDKATYQNDEGEGRSELKYLRYIQDIRDNKTELFRKIKRLPKKARSGKRNINNTKQLITFFRKGNLKKFFATDENKTKELTFFEAVDVFECSPKEKRIAIPKDYYYLLKENKEGFYNTVSGNDLETLTTKGNSNVNYLIKRLKDSNVRRCDKFTDTDEEYIELVLSALQQGIITKKTIQRVKNEISVVIDPVKIINILKKNIPANILYFNKESSDTDITVKREVVLSEYQVSGDS